MIDVTPDPKPAPSEPREPKRLKQGQGFRSSPKYLRDDFRFRVLHEFGGRCIMLGETLVEGGEGGSVGPVRPSSSSSAALSEGVGEETSGRRSRANGDSDLSAAAPSESAHVCDGPLDPAHLIPKATLRKLGLPETVVFDHRNGVAACRKAHRRNDDGIERFPRELLPPSVEEFAKAHGLSYLLDKSYPKKSERA